jgi:RNA polymerase sigma factor (sigma-70 family)
MPKALMDQHDVELAALAAAGGRREFGELVRRHGSAVRSLLRRMGAQGAEADDVAQDAFLQAFEKCAEFRGEGTFAAWVKRIAARLYLKRKAKDARYVAEIEPGESDAAPVRDQAGLVDLDEALKSLSETERLCVSLCHGAGLSHPEIAAAMNLPLGTVKSHVSRGLNKLRARLSPDASESGRSTHVG